MPFRRRSCETTQGQAISELTNPTLPIFYATDPTFSIDPGKFPAVSCMRFLPRDSAYACPVESEQCGMFRSDRVQAGVLAAVLLSPGEQAASHSRRDHPASRCLLPRDRLRVPEEVHAGELLDELGDWPSSSSPIRRLCNFLAVGTDTLIPHLSLTISGLFRHVQFGEPLITNKPVLLLSVPSQQVPGHTSS